jgi:chromosome partitioning protein
MDGTAKNWKLLEPLSHRSSVARVVCVVNQKGGVGKTTTSVNLAAALALRGHRALVVDLDPQANATTGLGINHQQVRRSTYDVLLGEASLKDVVLGTAIDGLFCAPAAVDLAGSEIELVSSLAREHKLQEAMGPARAEYDIVFIDSPPSLGLLTLNALVGAEDIIVPVQCEYYALEGLGQLLGTAERVRRALNPDLRITGFLLTMYDARTRLASQVADEVRSHFGDLVFSAVVPRSVRLSEAPSFGEPVLTLDPSSRGSIAYKLLAAEVEKRYGLRADPKPPVERPAAREVVDVAPERVLRVPDADERERVPLRAGAPGPSGRGYGTKAPQPPALEDAWPPRPPWVGEPL